MRVIEVATISASVVVFGLVCVSLVGWISCMAIEFVKWVRRK